MATVKPVLRRSHTKSKFGCQACKQRHVKCDEFRPTWCVIQHLITSISSKRTKEKKKKRSANVLCSHRCLSSKIPCKYPTNAEEEEEEGEQATSALWWPVDIEQSCEKWKESGEPPFLSLSPSPSWHNMEMKDLRYIYKMALVDNILNLSKTTNICLLWGEMRM